MNDQGKAEARIACASDVIVQLEARSFRARPKYLLQLWYDASMQDRIKRASDLQELLVDPPRTCHACARGALLLSMARLYDRVPINVLGVTRRGDGVYLDAHNGYRVNSTLLDIFSYDQIGMIECAFEKNDDMNIFVGTVFRRKSASFGRKFATPRQRLLGIMRNIVENGGMFTP